MPTVQAIQPLRTHDQSLMQIAIKSGKFTNTELQLLNNFRLFLQVISLAEISDDSGTLLHPAYTTKQPILRRPSHNGTSKIIWPYQTTPPQTTWNVWYRLMNHVTKPSTKSDLITPLGPWTNHHSTTRDWPYYYVNKATTEILHLSTNAFWYSPTGNSIFALATTRPILPPYMPMIPTKISHQIETTKPSRRCPTPSIKIINSDNTYKSSLIRSTNYYSIPQQSNVFHIYCEGFTKHIIPPWNHIFKLPTMT
jgi:hypothetical protein